MSTLTRPTRNRLRSLKVAEWQWRAGLQRLDCNVATYFSNDRQGEQFAYQKPLIIRQLWHDNFEKVVGFPRHQMASHDLRHVHDCPLKQKRMFVCVPIDLDADKH